MQTSLISPRYLRTEEAALFLGLSPRTLEKHRTYGTGPIYRKLGKRVVYAIPDLQQWADSRTVSSTSDPNDRTARPTVWQAGKVHRKA
ncbi:MAG: helix-turn-helix domain-containing protein [Pseudomonadota bacterium]